MSGRRIVCGVSVAAAWLLILLFLPKWVLFAILLAASARCLFEYHALLKAGGRAALLPEATLLGSLWLAAAYAWPIGVAAPLGAHTGEIILAAMLFFLLARILFDSRITAPIEIAGATLLGFLYIPFTLGFFIRLAQWGATAPFELTNQGVMLAGYLAAVVKMSDVGGYFLGSLCGRHKLFPRISPGKTWEGLAGGLLFSALTSLGFVWAAHHYAGVGALTALRLLTFTQAIACGLLLAGTGVIGDLIESMIKRAVKQKDSSALFPGMGGFLDTFDSLLFAPAALYAFLLFATL